MEVASGDRTVPMTLRPRPMGSGPDLVSSPPRPSTSKIGDLLHPLLGPETTVQTIQNGLGSPEVAARSSAPIIAVGVVGGFGASMRAPGQPTTTAWR